MSTKETDQPPFDASLVAAGAAEAIAALDRAGSRAGELIEQWKNVSNVAALDVAADLAQGPVRKAARRAISVLKSRGVPMPPRQRVAALRSTDVDERVEAYSVAPDATGGVVVVLAARTPTGRYRTAFVYLHDEIGIRRVEAGEQSLSQLREAMSRLVPGGAVRPVPVPVEWVRFRIAQARAKHKVHGQPTPLGLTTAASLLEPLPAEPPPHPLDTHLLEPSEELLKAAPGASGALHRLPEFRGWLPPKEAVDALLGQVGENLQPGEEPSQEKLSGLLEAAVIKMTDRFFAPQVRERLVMTMKDSALSVLGREGELIAMEVLATMRVISQAGLITNPPHEIGFLRGFFDKAIAVLLAQGQGSLRIPIRQAPAQATDAPVSNGEATAG
ncbi:MAG: hypothetical protein QM784_02775 [Polyangiaceae bacterium]